jgi:N-acetyl-gamma-glutamyl-phosphate reductase
MIRALIFGATGYTGIELVRILTSHPEVVVAGGSSRQWAGKAASEVFPFLYGKSDFKLSTAEDLIANPDGDVAFLALPHGRSAASVRPLIEAGLKVVDLSADCRIHDPKVYEEWYGPHSDPEILGSAVFGLPEIHRESIRASNLTANPGCYPTSVILGVAPLVDIERVDTVNVLADSKSGISGAGRGLKAATSFCESGEGFGPYGVLGHRHIPEMEQELTLLNGAQTTVRFTPHLIPVSRGMVSTIYLRRTGEVSADELRDRFNEHYADEPFVRVLPAGSFPRTTNVRGSNQCHVSLEVDERSGWVITMSALDNLVKGASGQAVQNMNLMTGLEEAAGLEHLPMFP